MDGSAHLEPDSVAPPANAFGHRRVIDFAPPLVRSRLASSPTSPAFPLKRADDGVPTVFGLERTALEEAVHRIHDRYLVEVVEQLGICPFARKSRELGRVLRPLVFVQREVPPALELAHQLAAEVQQHPDVEIVLLTFVGPGPQLRRASDFDALVEPLRLAYTHTGAPHFFMVSFHPGPHEDASRALTKDALVPLLRRSPDPVIQCVRADMLERVRKQAQAAAHARRLAELDDSDPVLRALLENSIQTDCELSADIARRNFETCGRGTGRDALERSIVEISRDRYDSYGHHFDVGV